MSCTNDPLTMTIPSNQTTTMELQCTPYGNATLTFFSNTLNGVQVTFKCLDTTPRISGVRRVLSQEYELQTAGQAFMAYPPDPPRKANLNIPYDQASVVVPENVHLWAYTIVDPVGWFPVPEGTGVGQFERVFDQSGTRLLYTKIPAFKGQSLRNASKWVIVELNPA